MHGWIANVETHVDIFERIRFLFARPKPHVEVHLAGEVAVLRLAGVFNYEADRMIREGFSKVKETGSEAVVVNLRDGRIKDNRAAGELLNRLHDLHYRTGYLKIVLPSRPERWWEVSELGKLAEIYDEEDEALRSFKGFRP